MAKLHVYTKDKATLWLQHLINTQGAISLCTQCKNGAQIITVHNTVHKHASRPTQDLCEMCLFFYKSASYLQLNRGISINTTK